ncbi:MAG: hypothetical protein HOO06_05925 [Bdellovibrionaceae bacterium]|jgi:hypothetical protein|nr:hypothetical protein [Pseudobdellovibrionaceae bacterium]
MKKIINSKLLIIVLIVLFLPLSLWSKPKGKATGKKSSKKNTVINFDDELIVGENQKPELFYLLQKKQYNYKKLIKLREHFLPELRNTSEDYSRDGRSD